MTPAAWGVPTASGWGGRIRGGPQVGKVATLPLPPGGTISEKAHKWAQWQSAVGKLIFGVSNYLPKKPTPRGQT